MRLPNSVSLASDSTAFRSRASWRELGRHEIGRAGGFPDVLVGRRTALGMIAFEQRFRRSLAQHAIEFPRQILGIFQAGIGAPGAERRDLMRGIAGEDHAAMDEFFHPAALEFVKRYPFEIELVVPEHARDPRPHILGQLLDGGIGIRIELQIDPPDVVRLLVQQRRPPGVKRRVEPEPALGGKFGRHLDVGDQELILEHLAGEFRADHLPQRRPRAVAGHDVVRAHPIGAVRRLDGQHHMIVALLQPDHLVAPAQIDRGQLLHPIHQIGLGIELLEVDEGGPLVPFLRQQIELIKQRRAVKNPADAPHHALVDHAIGDAEPIPEFEGALGKADRARPFADPVGIVEQNDGLAALRQIDRERQPDRAGPDHHHGVFGRVGCRRDPGRDGVDSRTGLWTAAPCVHAALGKDLIGKNLINKNFIGKNLAQASHFALAKGFVPA